MDPSKTAEESPADAKEPESKAEQVNTLCKRNLLLSTYPAHLCCSQSCCASGLTGVNGCESDTSTHCYTHVHMLVPEKGVSMLCALIIVVINILPHLPPTGRRWGFDLI